MQNIEVRPVKDKQELDDMFHQRWLVLRSPLGMDKGTEKDKHEDSAFHLVAVCDHKVVGSARLRLLSKELGSIAYLAVLPEFRHQGIGTKLMEKLIEIAHEKNLNTLRLMSRVHAVNFYKRLGFCEVGEPFYYLDVSHIFMQCKLQQSQKNAKD
ncbi:GNAT family N-acetyltransferase [Brasilonema bromeliae]|uniref:GNAT family N-acetyltransferase n=1 Tax=Brasilonema bromeliae SPC951 TaxID=385972 RepID=A0ABX1P6D5_9CYAN|nr:GNAT family N-acetyltransferase [Brasilonema bromeliae]NMG19849.1 GNAT family N-acetyltransferase [Brasilonema bromeliae SPC951]